MRNQSWLKSGLLVLTAVCLIAGVTRAQTQYFPNGFFSSNDRLDSFLVGWYSEQLSALQEPSLWEQSKTLPYQSYRFLWLRSFRDPVAIRVDVKEDGTSQLTSKVCGAKGSYFPGVLVRNITTMLTKEQTAGFLKSIEEQGFWTLEATEKSTTQVHDGSTWIIEGVKGKEYHVVQRLTPASGPVRSIGLLMINDLAKLGKDARPLY